MERINQNPRLEKFIDSILNLTGAKQVDLIGHSAGGGVGYAFLDDSLRMLKVAHYVHIGSTVLKAPAGKDGKVPTINIYSTADRVVKSGDIPGATNLKFTRFDHFELVTADSVARSIFDYLNSSVAFKPGTPKTQKGSYSATGRVISFGQNTPQAGAKILVQKVETKGTTGPVFYETVSDGHGAFQLKGLEPNEAYLVECRPKEGRVVSYFFPNILPNEKLLYLRTLPNSGMVATMLGNLPQDSSQSGIILFSNKKAIISGRDTLMLNDITLSTPTFADASKTAVAWFLMDGNKNEKTDTTLIQPLSNFPFMRAIDIYVDPSLKTFSVQLNGKLFHVPALPSSKSLILVVL
jgi:hypothetical protein